MRGVWTPALLLSSLLLWTGGASAAALLDLPGIELIGPEETLSDHTTEGTNGTLHFRQSDGSWVRLITSIEDPEIRNQGAGAFFPPSIDEVENALRALPPELLEGIEVQIFLLPYPRSGMLGSSADGLGIYLTPGVRAYSPPEIHYLVAHELGHAFHRHHIPYGDPAWDRYRALRGLTDGDRFRFDGVHANRPQEILAEDFRTLFGGALARGSGDVENQQILRPDEVPGLEAFFHDLLGPGDSGMPGTPSTASLAAFHVAPNPVAPGGQLTLQAPPGVEIRSALVFGVSGRMVTDARSVRVGDDWRFVLGRSLAPGAYWLRLELQGAPPRSLPIRVTNR